MMRRWQVCSRCEEYLRPGDPVVRVSVGVAVLREETGRMRFRRVKRDELYHAGHADPVVEVGAVR